MRLSELLHPQRIKCGLSATTKDEALQEMVELVAAAKPTITADDLLQALTAREKQGPFSMGKGTAFPHARTEKVSDFTIALGTSKEGIDFRAPDGRLIHVVLLFVVPKKHSDLYLRTLAAFLSFFQVDEHISRVIDAKDGAEAAAIIDELGPKPKKGTGDPLPLQTVAAIHLDTPLEQVADRLRASGLDSLPVVDPSGDLLGEVRAPALLAVAVDKGRTPLSGFPDLLIRNRLTTLQEDVPRPEVSQRLASSGATYAYVLRGRRLLGRIVAQDFLKP